MNRLSMLVGTCEDLSHVTMRQDCAPKSYVLENLDYLYIDSKHLTQFFDFVHYNHPDDGLTGTLQTNRIFYRQPLSSNMYTKKIFSI